MIDFQKAEAEFKEYVKHYDQKEEKVKLKIRHTYEVVKLSRKIAQELNLTQEEIKLAELMRYSTILDVLNKQNNIKIL